MESLLVLSVLLSARVAEADVHLDAEALTDFPLDIGGRLGLELPMRLRLSTEFGVMPEPYSDAINDFLVAVNVYPQQVATLIATALHDSFVWRTHLGWRPFQSLGLYVDAGYGLVTLGGGLSASSALQTGTQTRTTATAATDTLNLNSTLHMIDVEIGYVFVFMRHLVLRFALGGAFTVGASTSVSSSRTALENSRAFQAFATAAGTYLDNTYRSYVFSPVVTAAIGYRFF